MYHQIKNSRLGSEKEIKKYFKQKYNWGITEGDYQEVSQSLYFLGKAIYIYLIKQNTNENT